MPANSTDGSSGGAPVKKSKSFKRIRGLLSGKSRRNKKQVSSEEKPAAAAVPGEPATAAAGGEAGTAGDEQSTVYNVDVEDRSVITAPSSKDEEKKAYMLKVVLLLMDPETRRFELLQLEFDSLKALVSDVLAQIPVSVTEEPLRQQTYTGICGRDGKEMSPEKLLSSFCKGNDVLVAIPTSMPAKECARLARPILSDEKVVQMLLSSGVDAKAWREKKKKSRSVPRTPVAAAEPPNEPAESADTSVTGKTFTVLFMILAGILFQVFHLYISAPVKPGHVVSPGIWLTKCGIMSFVPSCENSYVTFSDDGVVKLFNADDEVMWEIEGAACQEGDEDCVPGMQVKDDNTLVVGGKQISSVKIYEDDAELSPWPFAEQPNVKLVKSKK